MYRVFIIIVNLIAAILTGSVFQSGITCNIETPADVVAGSEFEVRVNIQKGDIEGFSRLLQDLPAGLSATSYLSSDADFSFEEKRVRLIWLRLPRQEDFSIVYKIKVDERLKGTFDIKGKFSFIENNERKSVNVQSTPITISPSPNIDPSLIVDISEFEQKVVPYIAPATAGGEIACIRQNPIPQGDGSLLVNILVNKESKQKFAKIEELIPAGYEAISSDPKEAIFTYKKGMVKFLWMNLPTQPYFIVSYKLIPKDKKATEPQFKGTFSYLEEEKTISIDIKQTERDLASLTAPEIGDLINYLATAPVAINQKSEIAKVEEKPLPVEKEKKSIFKRNKKAKGSKNEAPYLLEPENGVYFRVQIAAGHEPVKIERYFKKYKLDKEVRKEYHEGWQKYSIGSFTVYKDARDYRTHLWNTTVINDAFVSAYNNGNRITVQEALMIVNQQWYR